MLPSFHEPFIAMGAVGKFARAFPPHPNALPWGEGDSIGRFMVPMSVKNIEAPHEPPFANGLARILPLAFPREEGRVRRNERSFAQQHQ